jgi:hypothetical protein
MAPNWPPHGPASCYWYHKRCLVLEPVVFEFSLVVEAGFDFPSAKEAAVEI